MLDLALPRLRFQLLIVGIQYLGFSSQSDTNFHNSKPIVGFELLEITPIHEHPNQLFVTWFKFFHSEGCVNLSCNLDGSVSNKSIMNYIEIFLQKA